MPTTKHQSFVILEMHIQAHCSVQANISLASISFDRATWQSTYPAVPIRTCSSSPLRAKQRGKKTTYHCTKVILIWPGDILWWGFTWWHVPRHFHFLLVTSSQISPPVLFAQLSSPSEVLRDGQPLTQSHRDTTIMQQNHLTTQPSCPPAQPASKPALATVL